MKCAPGVFSETSWRPLQLVSLFVLLTGCGGAEDGGNPTLRIDRVRIDPGAELELEAGRGVGAAVEVDAEGRFGLTFACDTARSGYACDFDVIASVEAPARLTQVRAKNLEAEDFWYRIDVGALRVFSRTAYDLDEVSFRAPLGEAVRLDVVLDGLSATEPLAWTERGVVQTGAPSMPFELVPRVR